MTSLDLTQALAESITEILGTMFFSDVMDDCDENAAAPDALSASLVFHGPISGDFVLRIDLPAARLLASSFLAEEEDALGPDQIEEIICELANMICGGALTRLHPECICSLSHPEVLRSSTADSHASHDVVEAHHAVCLDGGRLAAYLAFRE